MIQTPNFNLSAYIQGSPNSPKLAIVLPGKLDTKDYLHMRSHVDYLSELGFLALSFDPPGTWSSGGEDINDYTITNYIQATKELITHFNIPTFLIGHSLGGTIAMLVGLKNPLVTHFGSIMSYYTFDPKIEPKYINPEWQSVGYKVHHRINPITLDLIEFRLPYHYLEDQVQYDVSDNLRHSPKPKLFILGQKDIVVKPQVVQSAYDLSAPPKELFKINVGHNYKEIPQTITQINGIIGQFLKIYKF